MVRSSHLFLLFEGISHQTNILVVLVVELQEHVSDSLLMHATMLHVEFSLSGLSFFSCLPQTFFLSLIRKYSLFVSLLAGDHVHQYLQFSLFFQDLLLCRIFFLLEIVDSIGNLHLFVFGLSANHLLFAKISSDPLKLWIELLESAFLEGQGQ